MPVEPLGPSEGSGDGFKRVVCYGDPGSGKTSWGRSIVTERTLAIDCGGGVGVLADVLPRKQIISLHVGADLQNIDQERLAIQLAMNFARAYEYVKQHVPDWLIIDEFNVVPQGLENLGRSDMNDGKKYLNEYGKPDPRTLYSELAVSQWAAVSKIKLLPCNMYMTCAGEIEWEMTWATDPKTGKEINKRTGNKWAAPALAGRKIMDPFLGAFDAILYSSTAREPMPGQPLRSITKFTVRTAPTPTIKAKCRALPSFPVADVLSIGQRTDDGVVTVSPSDITLAKLVAQMSGLQAGTIPASR